MKIIENMEWIRDNSGGVASDGLDFGEGIFWFYVFTGRFRQPTPFGDSIFRCTAKDRGERRAKGIAIPLNPLELMLTVNRTYFGCTSSQRCV